MYRTSKWYVGMLDVALQEQHASACSPQHGGIPSHRKELGLDYERRGSHQGLAAHHAFGHHVWVRGGLMAVELITDG